MAAFRRNRSRNCRRNLATFDATKDSLSNPLKILQVLPTLNPSVGGVAPAVIALSRGIARRGHEVDLLALDDKAAPWLADIGLNVHAIGPGLTNYRYSKELLPWLQRNREKYDGIIVNGLW